MSSKEATIDEVYNAVRGLATHVDDLAIHMDERFDAHDRRFDEHEERLIGIEQRMVTKDYLDDKIANLRGELVVLTRQEDKKLAVLVERLYGEKSLSSSSRKTVLGMEPFAKRV